MLTERGKQIRRDTIDLSKANGGYHYGGCFSIIEILIALYDHVLTENDRFILSKGHSCWPWYVILREKGLNPKLEGHPCRDPYNGIHCTTGSLGHGFPSAIGMAQAKKLKKEPGKIYVLMGDGECQEGTTWESLLIAAHYRLDNLVVIVDWNKCQGSGFVENILSLPENLEFMLEDMGWQTAVLEDGHDIESIISCLSFDLDEPFFVISHTIKGKGVSFMENRPEYHAKWLSAEQEKIAMRELGGAIK